MCSWSGVLSGRHRRWVFTENVRVELCDCLEEKRTPTRRVEGFRGRVRVSLAFHVSVREDVVRHNVNVHGSKVGQHGVPKQDMIPDIEEPGCTWGHYIEHLVVLHGGRAALVDLLIHRGSDVVDLPTDPQTIERAIRRLGTRGNGDGGKYGRWLIRYFGVPRPLIETARWMGQYHSRFSDLPTSLRYSQLLLWDRTPRFVNRLQARGSNWVSRPSRCAAASSNKLARTYARPKAQTSKFGPNRYCSKHDLPATRTRMWSRFSIKPSTVSASSPNLRTTRRE